MKKMKKFFTPEVKEVMDYMFNNGNFVFVDDFQKKFECPPFLKWLDHNDPEECGFMAEDGEQFVLQGSYLRLAEGECQLRIRGERDHVVKKVSFADLFGDREVVIGTNCERLHLMVPICKSKLELAEFILFLRDYEGDYYRDMDIRDMVKLAKYLYKHNPNKELDELDL